MRIKYFYCPEGNFGDDLNDWLWDGLIPGWREWDDDVTLFGVGTLINHKTISAYADRRVLVLGTGVGYGKVMPGSIPCGWDLAALRGPQSARLLGVSEDVGQIDPAILISDFPEFQSPEKTKEPIFVPHRSSVGRHDWQAECDRFGVNYVSPCEDARSVIKAIAGAPLVIAESMHAAIIAESFRVPWIPVRASPRFNSAKWIDFFESADVTPEILSVFPQVERLSKRFHIRPLRRYQKKLWDIVERIHIQDGMARMRDGTPVLGDKKELERRKANFREILEIASRRYS